LEAYRLAYGGEENVSTGQMELGAKQVMGKTSSNKRGAVEVRLEDSEK
jgi:hypothetical protein